MPTYDYSCTAPVEPSCSASGFRVLRPGVLLRHGGYRQWLRNHPTERVSSLPERDGFFHVDAGELMLLISADDESKFLFVLILGRNQFGWIHPAGQTPLL